MIARSVRCRYPVLESRAQPSSNVWYCSNSNANTPRNQRRCKINNTITAQRNAIRNAARRRRFAVPVPSPTDAYHSGEVAPPPNLKHCLEVWGPLSLLRAAAARRCRSMVEKLEMAVLRRRKEWELRVLIEHFAKLSNMCSVTRDG
jgi:hypothetical protein